MNENDGYSVIGGIVCLLLVICTLIFALIGIKANFKSMAQDQNSKICHEICDQHTQASQLVKQNVCYCFTGENTLTFNKTIK